MHSSRSASVASATSSVDARADHVDAEDLVVLLVATILTKPSVSPAIRARPSTPNLNDAGLDVVAPLLRLLFRQADAADLRIAVGAAAAPGRS